MAIQDDIMAMLSQVSDAGDRATDRGRRGSTLYSDIAQRLSVDDRKKAMREIAMLGDPMQFGSIEEQMQFDPLTGDRVATIIEKYMDDAGDGVPDDMIVDDTRAAERMMEVLPSPNTAPRIPVGIEELPVSAPQIPVDTGQLPPPLPRPDFDEAALESMERDIRQTDEGLAGLMAGVEPEYGINTPTPVQTEDEYAGTPGTSVGMNPVSDGRIPLKERLFAGQDAAGGPMSGTEQLMLGSAFIPLVMLPQAAARVGIGAAQVARFLRGGKKGEQALRAVIKKREFARDARGRFVNPKNVGSSQPPVSTPKTSTEATLDAARIFRQNLPQPAFNRGGAVRNNIMNTYGRI